jgi:hypothetical protein
VDAQGVATEGEDLPARSVYGWLLDAGLLLADAADKLLDDLLEMRDNLLSVACQLSAYCLHITDHTFACCPRASRRHSPS